MHWLSQIFLVAVATSLLAQLWLSFRQTRAVQAHRDRVPAPFAERISEDDHRKAADYTVARERVGRIDSLVDVALLLVLTLGGGIAYFDSLWRDSGLSQPWLGTAVILTVFFAQMLIGMPLSIYRTFR
ncbi:MAG TPA: hypothetical protein VK629_04585, partial [Steroidobacteraceae bacterium]|nr:hypothetical protein [Steroidobacteraceae bacterium]